MKSSNNSKPVYIRKNISITVKSRFGKESVESAIQRMAVKRIQQEKQLPSTEKKGSKEDK